MPDIDLNSPEAEAKLAAFRASAPRKMRENAAWEEVLRQHRQTPATRPGQLGNNAEWTKLLSDDMMMNYLNLRRGLIKRYASFAKDLFSDPLSLFIVCNWRRIGLETKKFMALIPDMTLEFISEGDGLEYLLNWAFENGVKALSGEDDWQPLVSAEFDKIWPIKRTGDDTFVSSARGHLFSLASLDMMRHLLLIELAMGLCKAPIAREIFNPRPHLYHLEKATTKPSSRDPKNFIMHNPAPSLHGDFGAVNNAGDLGAGWEEMQRGGPEVCDACGREREQVQELMEAKRGFSHCSRCVDVGRKHPYCSRDCQVQHYKHHKKICGKALADVVPTPSFPIPTPRPPLAPYAARWQYERHRLHPYAMYTVCLELPEINEPGPRSYTIKMVERDLPVPPHLLSEEDDEDDDLSDLYTLEARWRMHQTCFTNLLDAAAEAGEPLPPDNVHFDLLMINCLDEVFEATDDEFFAPPGTQDGVDTKQLIMALAAQIGRDFDVEDWESIAVETRERYTSRLK
ncbi:hypothetical protein JCM8097_002852 [Rhodosporidiobolus ruineniae]